ncbi:PQQ-binding-like beta-propeller repeat protein [Streptomyces sp. NPDC048604]|uniref:protein kinase domain-containing protein n=1 Tax=Streptomyces sp. NPDC048604 TaxID=3365578 RepID=UPI00371EA6D1
MPPLRSTGVGREAEDPEYAGEYRLGACLGSGGMGVVHLAHSASGLRLAVKVVHEGYASDPEFRARFRQEVAAARRVSGAFTAPVVDADPDAERPWMATLYVPGPTLAEQVKRSGPLSPAELRRLTAGLAEALRDIHRAGVVHRDLKPGNVLLTDSGPKVIDFGISRPSDSDVRTETGKLIGSPPFMAPEQFQRPREVGPAADVFALGSVLVHAATGTGPFDSDSPYLVAYQVVHDEPDLSGVPAELAPLVARCLAKEPGDRPTPDEIMAALQPPSYEAAAFVPAQRRPLSPSGAATLGLRPAGPDPAATVGAPDQARTRAVRRRRRPLGLVAAAVVVALAVGGVLAAWPEAGDERQDRRQRASATKPIGAWRTPLRTAGDSAPACSAGADGAVYCAARGTGAAQLDPSTGAVVWSRQERTGIAVAAPVLAAGTVGASVGEDGGRFVTYDAAGGRPGWSTAVPANGAVHPAGDTLLLGSGSGTVTAVDARTGERLWRRALPGHRAPLFGPYDGSGGVVHVFEETPDGTRTLVSSVRARTGETVHRRVLNGRLVPAGVSGGALFLTARGLDGLTEAVVRHDPATGAAEHVPLPFRLEEPQAVVAGDVVHLLTRAGILVAVDTVGGRTLWQLETAAGRVSAPVLGDGGRLYFSTADGRLLAVDTARGVLLGQTEPRLRGGRLGHAASVPAPVVVGPRVVGTAPDGSVFAVDGADPAAW